MFHIVDIENDHRRVKGGFTTAAKAYEWGKKNLGKDSIRPWNEIKRSTAQYRRANNCRYYIQMD